MAGPSIYFSNGFTLKQPIVDARQRLKLAQQSHWLFKTLAKLLTSNLLDSNRKQPTFFSGYNQHF